ncbi:MAG: cysteine hydrolase [Desulfobacteraceae bacterium]|nr:cysteine hydrolase [Desulfobacteraceae bacterium]
MCKKLLIIVDMLNDFIDENGALYCGETAGAIVPFVKSRLETFRKVDDPVVYLTDAHDENDLEFEKFPRHCVAGTWGSQIIDELTPRANETIVLKKRYSGFFGTGLESILEQADPNEVEVVGVCTSICVMDTVGGLANRDYTIKVPVRGVADFDQDFHGFALKRMAQLYGAQIIEDIQI